LWVNGWLEELKQSDPLLNKFALPLKQCLERDWPHQGFQGDKNSAFILKGLEILARVFPQTKANHINMLGAPP
jgi:hypothetical protein